jgi:hypothetical protein
MSLAQSPVIGTIQIEPRAPDADFELACDDSTLELLLNSFAHCESLAEDGDQSICLVASTRLSRYGLDTGDAQVAVRADVARLLHDLQCEYRELGQPL